MTQPKGAELKQLPQIPKKKSGMKLSHFFTTTTVYVCGLDHLYHKILDDM